jgi:hypothetical protein
MATLLYLLLAICLVSGIRMTLRAFGADGTPRREERAPGIFLLGVSVLIIIIGSVAGY